MRSVRTFIRGKVLNIEAMQFCMTGIMLVNMSWLWRKAALLHSACNETVYLLCYNNTVLFVLTFDRGDLSHWGFCESRFVLILNKITLPLSY